MSGGCQEADCATARQLPNLRADHNRSSIIVAIVVPTCPGIVSERRRIVIRENEKTKIVTTIETKIKNDDDRDEDTRSLFHALTDEPVA